MVVAAKKINEHVAGDPPREPVPVPQLSDEDAAALDDDVPTHSKIPRISFRRWTNTNQNVNRWSAGGYGRNCTLV